MGGRVEKVCVIRKEARGTLGKETCDWGRSERRTFTIHKQAEEEGAKLGTKLLRRDLSQRIRRDTNSREEEKGYVRNTEGFLGKTRYHIGEAKEGEDTGGRGSY